MKSEKWTGVRAASVAGVWVAILFIICGARAQESKEKVTINDVDRAYVVRLPRGYDQERKYPVVILLHGMNQDGDDMARLTRFNELADKDSIIAVYPSALHGRWNVGVRPPLRRVMGPGPRRYPGGGYPRRVLLGSTLLAYSTGNLLVLLGAWISSILPFLRASWLCSRKWRPMVAIS